MILSRTIAAAVLGLAVAVLPAARAGAASEYGELPPAPAAPDQMLRDALDRLGEFFSAASEPSAAELRAFLDAEIAPHFDFAYMSKWAAGPFYRRLDEAQRAAFSARLSDLFLSALTRNLGSYIRPVPEVQIDSPRPGRSPNEVAVTAHVAPFEGFLIRLEFRFYWSPGGWKIFDVVANGISAVAYYRRYFNDLLRRHGPEALLSR